MNEEPRVGFIGAGKVGCTLGKYFSQRGITVGGYYSRNTGDAVAAAAFTQSQAYETAMDLVRNSDIVFLTVPDTIIVDLWDTIRDEPLEGKAVCHCSGLHSVDVFESINQTGAVGCSLHPLCAISDRWTSYQAMRDVYFTLEKTADNVWMKVLIRRMGNPVHPIDAAHKARYHAAAVFCSNLVVGLAEIGVDLFRQCGLDDSFANQAWRALFLANAQNIGSQGTVSALTGPIERNDVSTVKRHLDALEGVPRDLYAALSNILVNIAKQKHPDRVYTEMEEVLSNEKHGAHAAKAKGYAGQDYDAHRL